MTTIESPQITAPKLPARLPEPDGRAVPFARLVHVELRKILDTRAGRWLLIGIAGVTALVVGIVIFTGSAGSHKDLSDFLAATVIPQSILLPLLGIITVTSEWTQRTGLVTFALEPDRTRVGRSKLVSAILLGLLVLAIAVVLAVVATGLCQALRGGHPVWSLDAATLGGVVLAQLLAVVQGVSFGLVLQNTPAAIVSYLVLPQAWSIVGTLVHGLHGVQPWLDLNAATTPLLDASMTAENWAELGVAALVWVVLPLIAGVVRLRRSEVK
ncbi:ABC transporter permease [Allobranchiibius sp. CTAmp26]|uniref:ABC transporter permease n=1 Tax=Allobranchiibius sp. CTAmp26 TaxID=2815214 RepID=UPI001AA11A9E|nr:ABC transporter permease [Allobranchiibius sp. CTAmp26]MBO1753493.1 ABC transporter permease [Allobranchiibius sp. CTAmp26]